MLNVLMLNVDMLNAAMLNVVVPNVVMLSVVAPLTTVASFFETTASGLNYFLFVI